ncbi:MAG: hypothetical protein GWP17_02205 [Aquificales bacterium]|nr:hypothetical protein [Aquificales bacterium]
MMLLQPIHSTHYQTYYRQQLPRRLHRLLHFIQDNKTNPDVLHSHFQSMMALLDRALQMPGCQSLFADLVFALHPWPVRWGWMDEWIRVLESAADLSRSLNRSRQQVDLSLYQAELLLEAGQLDKALTYGKQALALAQQFAYALPMAKAGWVLYRVLTSLGRSEEADKMASSVKAGIPADVPIAESKETAVWITLIDTRALQRRGRHREGRDHLQPLIAQLEADDLIAGYKATAFAVYAILLWNMNWYEQAAHYMVQAISVYRQLGDDMKVVICQSDLNMIYFMMGKHELAVANIQAAIAHAEEKRFYYQLSEHIGSLAGLYMTQGKLDDAQFYWQRHTQLTRFTGNKQEHIRSIINRGGVLLLMGEYEIGLADVEIGIPYYQSQNAQEMLTLCRLSKCYAYWGLGRTAEGKILAEDIYTEATTRLTGIPHLELFARRCLALFYSPAEAIVFLQGALALARKHKFRMQEAACLLSMAGLVVDSTAREIYWTQGCCLLEDLDAADWLNGHTSQNPPFVGMIH